MYLLYVHEFLKNILRYPTNFFVFFLIRIPSLVTSLDNKFSAIPFLACVIKREIMITRKEKFCGWSLSLNSLNASPETKKAKGRNSLLNKKCVFEVCRS